MHFENEFMAPWLQVEIQFNQKYDGSLNYQSILQRFDTFTLDAIYKNVNGICNVELQ